MNNNVNVKVDFDMTNLMTEIMLIKSKTESIDYAIKLLLSDEQVEQVNQMSDFFLLNNTVSLYERTTDFDKDSADYIEMKNNLAKVDSELTEKGLLQPE
jgi:hypothetical protein